MFFYSRDLAWFLPWEMNRRSIRHRDSGFTSFRYFLTAKLRHGGAFLEYSSQ